LALLLWSGWLQVAAADVVRPRALDSGPERLWQGPAEAELQLPDSPLEPGTLAFTVETQRLREGLDYRVDAVRGRVSLLQPRWLGRPARIRYRVLRLDLPESLALQRRAELPWLVRGSRGDSLAQDSLRLAALPGREEEFASRLRTSGSFLRGVKVGSGGQVGMESGLRLQVEGQIGPDVDVEAFLSDRNTPIQPEGRSQNLDEIDRIHVQVRSPRWKAQLGDIDLNLQNGQYLSLKRTVDGVQAGYDDGRARLVAHLAGSRGRFRRQEFPGLEGVLGPYQLRSEQGGDQILVLAGSERVWLDGVELTRGEEQDYVMDYGLAQLQFTARRPITGESRLQVEFQYAERVYARSLYGFTGESPLAPGLSLRLGMAGERDDKERPLDVFLDEADRRLLAAAGDGSSAVTAWGAGVREVDPGEGSYRLVDSLAGRWGQYEWAEEPLGDERFRYVLRFSERGRAPDGTYLGDYSRQFSSSGRIWYRFEGLGGGAWAPVIPLTAPTANDVVDGVLAWRRGRLELDAEAALSRQDLNLFSTQGDGDNQGAALRAGLRWSSAIWPASRPLGRVEVDGLAISEQADFRALQQVDEVEFERLYGLARGGGLRRHDLGLAFRGGDSLLVRGRGAWLSRQNESSRMLESAWRWRPRRGVFQEGAGRVRRREGTQLDRFETLRLEQGWRGAGTTLGSAWETERQRSGDVALDGKRWRQGLLRVEQRLGGGEASLERLRRVNDRAVDGHWARLSVADQVRTRLRRSGSWQGELDWTHRRLDFLGPDSTDQVRDVALLDLRRQGDKSAWSLRYQVENSLAAERVIQYIRVDSLQGDYSRDPFNPELFVPDPDGDYVALPYETGRQSKAARLQLEGDLRWELGAWSGDHHGLAEELSRLEDPARLYLLTPSAFLTDSTQSARLQTRNDLELAEDRLGGSSQRRWRLRWSEERSLERPAPGSTRRGWLRTLGLRVQDRWGDWRHSLELERRLQETRMPGQVQDERRVQAWDAELEVSRELAPGWLGRVLAEGESAREERAGIRGSKARLEPSLDARLGPRGSASARLAWQQAWSQAEIVPFELLGGARVGRTWRAGLEGRLQLGKQSRLTLSWQLDALPERRAQHTGRLQVQSFF
jgi:hypothetical protein